MLCFREGCEYSGNDAGSAELVLNVGTRGSVGLSGARISIRFCSLTCLTKFCEEHKYSHRNILEKVIALSGN